MPCLSFLHVFRYHCQSLSDQGYDIDALLLGTGIAKDAINDVYSVVTKDQLIKLNKNILTQVGPSAGLHMGMSARLYNFGPVGYALLSAENLREASDILQHYLGMLTTLWSITTEIKNNNFYLYMGMNSVVPEDLMAMLLEYLMTGINCQYSELLSEKVPIKRVEICFKKGRSSKALCDVLAAPISFGCDKCCFIFDLDIMNKPLPYADQEVKEAALALCESLRLRLDKDSAVVAHVKQAILRHTGDYPSLDQIAAQLDMSSRTLRRRLSQQNTSYQQIISEARRNVALQLLQASRIPVQDVAYACGFSEVQNFSSAFRRWTGMSPTQYRNSH